MTPKMDAPTRRAIEGTIRSLLANADRAERAGFPAAAARRRELAAREGARLRV